MTAATEPAKRFFAGNSSTYDPIANLCTLGLDTLWKRQILTRIPQGAKQIIDQACGTGILTLQIARRFPHCRVIGVDLHDAYLNIARQKAGNLRLSNVEFICGYAEDIIFEEGSIDCITSSYLAKYADLDRLVSNAKRMLRKDGTLILHELTCPVNPAFLGLWKLHFRFLQTYGVWRYPEWERAFRELPALLKETRWVEDLLRALDAHHISNIRVMPLIFQTSTLITAENR